MDEKRLLELLQKKPEEGMRTLMENYMGFCYAIVNARLSGLSREDKEDCVSDIFLELYRCREKIDLEKGGISAFLAILSRRRAIDFYMRAKRREDLHLEKEPAEEEKGLSFEERQALSEGLQALGEEEKKILIWKYYYGYSTKQIAAALGRKENTVDQRGKRALAKLKALLKGGGFYEG